MEKIISLEGISLIGFFGQANVNINKLANSFPTSKVVARGNEIKLIGPTQELVKIEGLISMLLEHYNRFGKLSPEDVVNYIELESFQQEPLIGDDVLLYGNKGVVIKAKSEHQKTLVKEIKENDITFAVGPAGTGKTYLAVAMAVSALKNKEIKKIIITRPVVEAGESLGFLPGDLKEKIDPYLRPIYDSLEDMLPVEKMDNYFENNIIEIAPLAFMRGRTLSNAYVILDEAQNTTPMQIKMFLTRLGLKSKMIITGDMSQVDLPTKQKSGLKESLAILKNVKGVAVVSLDGADVVRHKVVRRVIEAYEKHEEATDNNRR